MKILVASDEAAGYATKFLIFLTFLINKAYIESLYSAYKKGDKFKINFLPKNP